MDKFRRASKWVVSNLRILGIIISFTLPIAILFTLYPNSFQFVWGEARAPYILFIWFFCLELALWLRKLRNESLSRNRVLAILLVAGIPIIYVVATSLFGLQSVVIELGKALGVPYATFGQWLIDVCWSISVEYLVFAASFTLVIFLVYRTYGLKGFLISIFFVWATTFFFMLNTFAPYGFPGVLQSFVPFTTRSAASVLNWLGYKTLLAEIVDWRGPGMMLTVIGDSSSFTAVVYWASAGVQSLIIYTGMILLFIKDTAFTGLRKVLYFAVGAAGTFVANICRIVSIALIALKIGKLEANLFHDYYGEFFFIAWMIIYLVLIVYGSTILNRLKHYRGSHSKTS